MSKVNYRDPKAWLTAVSLGVKTLEALFLGAGRKQKQLHLSLGQDPIRACTMQVFKDVFTK